MIQVE